MNQETSKELAMQTAEYNRAESEKMNQDMTRKDVICGFVCCLPFWYYIGAFWVYPVIVHLQK